ncbi:Ankyrin repeat protein [Cystobacter fuscus DSM 2262]|uniref:Ankyrin repeat protein n=1 Tax=Cystobacter fuscus (strain ATCC 25194 / DSM 2262 / NBRC 100088 / M29) TaxID=1242864 RepID=S9P470_CYSF2|nr:ankyrin repeat domain-containing protein [Cystobacter fuscus]EPX57971.1 Ankyrin repeat protein [Cystobacter fuscus DSM 2262]
MSLFDAVVAGDVSRVEALLAGGADPNPFDAEGRTPLMLAAERGEEPLARVLLAGGADPSLTDRLGESALTKAAAHGHRRLAALFYPQASPDEQDMARALLQVGSDFFSMPREAPPPPSGLMRKLASASAYVSQKLGDDVPTQRLERLERAQKNNKKS